MKISNISLQNFRNYADTKIKPDKITILVGANGSGKSNLIEAIRLASVMRSFRAKRNEDMIRTGEDVARVEVNFKDQSLSHKVAVSLTPGQNIVKFNSHKVPLSRAVGQLLTVLFSPEDMQLLVGPPTLRRRFLNNTLSQTNSTYMSDLVRLATILRQRNQVLHQIASGRLNTSDLGVWNELLCQTSTRIQAKRLQFVKYLQSQLPELSTNLGFKSPVKLLMTWSKPTLELLDKNLSRDLHQRSTTIGPHLDDFDLEYSRKPLARFGSRGQQRSAIVALKFGEIDYIEENSSRRPILLLDDIFSELDLTHRTAIKSIVDKQQTIITAISARSIPVSINGKIIKIREII